MSENSRQNNPAAPSPEKPPVKLNIRNTLIITAIVIAFILVFVFGIIFKLCTDARINCRHYSYL